MVDYDDALRALIWTLPDEVRVSRTPDGVWDLRRGDERLCIAEEFGDDGHVDGWTWTEYTAAIDDGAWDTLSTDGQSVDGWARVERVVRGMEWEEI